MCPLCKKNLYLARGSKPINRNVLEKWKHFNLNQFNTTRNCESCTVCSLSKVTGSNLKIGKEAPKIIVKKNYKKSLCSECFQVIGKGIPPTCNIKNRKKSLEKAVLASNNATKEEIASKVIKAKCYIKGESVLLQTGGNKLKVSPGTSCLKSERNTQRPVISTENMAKIQKNLSLSEQVLF